MKLYGVAVESKNKIKMLQTENGFVRVATSLSKIFHRSCLLSFVCIISATSAYANPVGGNVSAGSATITQSGNTLQINQSSNKAVIDWSSFNIAPGEITQFNQPS